MIDIPWTISHWIIIWYLLTSVICFTVYGFDKTAAIAGRWRVSEVSLITWGLFGGWPGAILAQQFFRHKNKKPLFRIAFFLSVMANLAVLSALFAPSFLY